MGKKELLSRGCALCHQGATMVLFITGVCRRTCWYCPLSSQRKGKDAVWANEHPVTTPDEAIAVGRVMSALGSSITGGEPLERLERVVTFSRALKDAFGDDHYIHLYTGRAPGRDELLALSGIIDELRFHPPYETWESVIEGEFMRSAEMARDLGFTVGIEVPSLPGIGCLACTLPYLDFLNINELEWGESNAGEMRNRGLTPEDGVHNAVEGAREWARPLVSLPRVHWCSSRFKDSVQLRKRLVRIAGTVIYGVLESESVPTVIRDLGDDMYEVRDGMVETAWWVITRYAGDLPGKKSVLERYPDRGLVVEVTPV